MALSSSDIPITPEEDEAWREYEQTHTDSIKIISAKDET